MIVVLMDSKKLKDLKNKLTDISKRNRSITLRRCFKRSHYDLSGLSKVGAGLSEKVLSNLIFQKSASALDLQTTKNLETKELYLLKTLKRDSDFIEKETGNYDIYLGWPFIEGTFKDKTYFRCPLFLMPVRLEIDFEKEHFRFLYDETRPPSLNKAFLLAFQKFNETPIKHDLLEDIDELPWAKEQNNLAKIAEHIVKFYQESGILIDANSISKLEKLDEIQPHSKDDEKEPIVPFRLISHAVIGQFPQAVSSLLADYDSLIKRPPEEGKLSELLRKENESTVNPNEYSDKQMLESDNYFICPTDLSQEHILQENRKGKDLVVWGPPGTGKSQVIANLVADRVARGERVLVVCEKRAALDVVYRRLQKEGLASLLALVHSIESDRDAVYEKIRQIAENFPKIRQETDFDEISSEIDDIQNGLEEYATALHLKRKCGLTLYELYTNDKPIKNKTIDASAHSANFTIKELEKLIQTSKRAMPLKQKYDASNSPLRRRLNLANKSSKEITQFIDKLVHFAQLSKKIEKLPSLEISEAFADKLQPCGNKLEYLNKMSTFVKAYSQKGNDKWRWLDVFWWWNSDKYSETLATALVHHGEDNKENRIALRHAIRDSTLSKCALKTAKSLETFFDTMSAVDDGIRTINSMNDFLQPELINEWKTKLNALDMAPLSDIRAMPVIKKSYDDVQLLDTINGDCTGTEKELLELVFRSHEKLDIEKYEEILRASLYRAWIDSSEKESPIIKTLSREAYGEKCKQLDKLMHEKMKMVPQHILANWSKLVTSPMLFNWSEAQSGKIDGLVAWVKDEKNDWLDWEKVTLVDSGYNQVSIGDDERKVTVQLDDRDSSSGHGHLTVSLSVPVNRQNAYHLRNYSYQLTCRLVQRGKQVIIHQESDSLAQSLLHEVMKKRRRLTLRGFVDRFKTRGLFDIFPCWLCSPETVSAIMPMQSDLFDLVIFDEASQCPFEKAVPAIYRSKSVVVAGDDKQLPPFDLFKTYYSEDDDESEDSGFVQSESLLHAASSMYPMKPLLWHYRSKFDALIRFSNAAFYNNNLRTISYNEKNAKPIEWIKTKGTWEGRANKTEAKKVVSIIKDILSKASHPSIGVVTFNTEQKELIELLLEEEAQSDSIFAKKYAAEMNRKEGEELQNLFVKNIENVQGDERDIIIFSIAYSPDAQGRFILHFGTLSRAGGENRLNVAISRAKEKVIIVTSIEPDDLKVEGTLNAGPKMLKKYLTYAKAIAESDQKTASAIIESFGKPLTQTINTEYDSEFEVEVADSLRKMGYVVDTQVGCSSYRIDLAIRNPKDDDYLLGVECDGEAYHSSPSARERDVYRQRFLENRGWKIYRISSRDWWAERDEVLRKIKTKIKSIS